MMYGGTLRKDMKKPGIVIEIPGLGRREIKTIVGDYTGTHSQGGRLAPGVRRRLLKLARLVDIHILSADSFGTAREQLKGLPLEVHILEGERHDVQKKEFGERHEPRYVAAFGNGNNDRLLLRTVKEAGGIAIAVDNGEGCAIDALLQADLFIVGAARALDLLLEKTRCKATLRF